MKLLVLCAALLLACVVQAFTIGSFGGAQLTSRAPAAKSASHLSMEVKIVVGDGESVESALNRFKRAVARSGHMQELRYRRYFETTQERKKRKATLARKRARIARSKARKFANDY
ncbi:ribosomal protein S21-domain-containing protein [Tribonema minus]|uniref:Ribosomal protein S21-domain-containing protein n=1 Tax=Tribonema minus TaxID=303371 RepID=A0A835YQE4_9STRA|nr:ribosomal protein S21-domain-containing protein [Tribonema minus]